MIALAKKKEMEELMPHNLMLLTLGCSYTYDVIVVRLSLPAVIQFISSSALIVPLGQMSR